MITISTICSQDLSLHYIYLAYKDFHQNRQVFEKLPNPKGFENRSLADYIQWMFETGEKQKNLFTCRSAADTVYRVLDKQGISRTKEELDEESTKYINSSYSLFLRHMDRFKNLDTKIPVLPNVHTIIDYINFVFNIVGDPVRRKKMADFIHKILLTL